MMFEPKLQKPDYKLAERTALKLLAKAGVFEPPVNPVEIAKTLGVNVNFVTFTGEAAGVAGLYYPDKDEILVNAQDAGYRQTFTIAHELGHCVMHGPWARTEAYKVLWRDTARQGRDRWEAEANEFAANLLMPKQFVDSYQNLPIDTIARIFAVSDQMAKYRIKNLYGV